MHFCKKQMMRMRLCRVLTQPASESTRSLRSPLVKPPLSVVTFGIFDACHLGHQALVGQLVETAKTYAAIPTVILFEPRPLEFLAPNNAPLRLTNLRDQVNCLSACGVEQVAIIRFTAKVAALSPFDFVSQVLVSALNATVVWVGEDCRFGHAKGGNLALLKTLGNQFSFSVLVAKTLCVNELRLSSTLLRDTLGRGDFSTAEQYLGRPYQLCGRVRHGDQRGRQLGFPTLNIRLHKALVLHGVYLVGVKGLPGEAWKIGVANIGIRPSIGGSVRLLEVHVLNFNQSVYGTLVTIEFIKHIREEKKFDSLEALSLQIREDIEVAKRYQEKN